MTLTTATTHRDPIALQDLSTTEGIARELREYALDHKEAIAKRLEQIALEVENLDPTKATAGDVLRISRANDLLRSVAILLG